jgi:hypothetical protein
MPGKATNTNKLKLFDPALVPLLCSHSWSSQSHPDHVPDSIIVTLFFVLFWIYLVFLFCSAFHADLQSTSNCTLKTESQSVIHPQQAISGHCHFADNDAILCGECEFLHHIFLTYISIIAVDCLPGHRDVPVFQVDTCNAFEGYRSRACLQVSNIISISSFNNHICHTEHSHYPKNSCCTRIRYMWLCHARDFGCCSSPGEWYIYLFSVSITTYYTEHSYHLKNFCCMQICYMRLCHVRGFGCCSSQGEWHIYLSKYLNMTVFYVVHSCHARVEEV